MRLRTCLTVAILCGATMAPAQTGSADRVLKPFADCRAVSAPDARLACFDRAASGLEAAVKARDVTIVDRQDVRKARRSLFGLTLPRIDLFGGDEGKRTDKADAFTEINTTVAGVSTGTGGKVEIRLAEEGAPVWQVNDPMTFPPKGGAAIRIRQGALGNYFLFVGGRSYRGMRLR